MEETKNNEPNEQNNEVDEVQKNLEDIGKRIKKIRRELRLKQSEMAEKLDTFHSYISAVESGKANPGHSFFYKISKAFNINLNFLFHGIGDIFRSQRFDQLPLDGTPPAKLEPILSPEGILMVMEYSPTLYHNVIGYAYKFLNENETVINAELEKSYKGKFKSRNNQENVFKSK